MGVEVDQEKEEDEKDESLDGDMKKVRNRRKEEKSKSLDWELVEGKE